MTAVSLPNLYSGQPALAGLSDSDLDAICAKFPATDLGMCERFIARQGDKFRFDPLLSGWLLKDGGEWIGLNAPRHGLPPELVRAMWSTIRAVQRESALLSDAHHGCVSAGIPGKNSQGRILSDWGYRCERASYLRTLLGMVQPALTIPPSTAQTGGL